MHKSAAAVNYCPMPTVMNERTVSIVDYDCVSTMEVAVVKVAVVKTVSEGEAKSEAGAGPPAVWVSAVVVRIIRIRIVICVRRNVYRAR
jgi:hypothetical protein